MSTARSATPDAPGYGWLVGMSSWMLLTAIPGPLTAWLGFAIVAIVARKPRILVIAGIAGALAIIANLPFWADWQPVAAVIVYLAGMLVALAVNPGWLRTMWERRVARAAEQRSAARRRATSSTARTVEPEPSAPAPRRKSPSRRERAAAQKQAARAAVTAETTPEAAALAQRAGASSERYLAPAPEPATPAEPVDVNTAPADQLDDLPGMSRSRARKAVKERDRLGGFMSVEHFGEVVGLQPHEIVRLRRVATCSPRPRGERRFGRRVDY